MWMEYAIEKEKAIISSSFLFLFAISPLKYATTNIPTAHIRGKEDIEKNCVCRFLSYAQLSHIYFNGNLFTGF